GVVGGEQGEPAAVVGEGPHPHPLRGEGGADGAGDETKTLVEGAAPQRAVLDQLQISVGQRARPMHRFWPLLVGHAETPVNVGGAAILQPTIRTTVAPRCSAPKRLLK